MQGIILKDDKRYVYTESYLKEKGHVINKEGSAPEDLDFIVFPFMGEIDTMIYNDDYFSSLRPNIRIFSGVRHDYLSEKCLIHGLSYHVMTEARSVQVKNAIPTSEGVIAYLIRNRVDTITNSRVLVMGYGACGSDLAKRLKALDAMVYTLVRSKEKEAAALSDGIRPIYFNEFLDMLNFEVIINTIPARVLTNEIIDKTTAMLIDIASKPYGFDIEYAKTRNEKSSLLPGIPGKHALRTAGEILGEYIEQVLRGKLK